MNDELAAIVEKSLNFADRMIERPDVPPARLIPLMNELAALSTRLRFASAEISDKNESKKLEMLARGLEQIISTLKYQVKLHLENNGS